MSVMVTAATSRADGWPPAMERVAGMVSVVIPAYNAADLIAETLESVLAQSHSTVEIIVVDDGSTDQTPQVVGQYAPKVRLVRQANSGGCSSPRNHGLRLARGEFVTFFDADDLMCPEKLARQVAFLAAHPETAAVLMDYRNFDETGPAAESHFQTCVQLRAALAASATDGILDPAVATAILIGENYGIAGSPLFRASFFDANEAFDESLRASEDFDLIYRVARAGGLAIVDKVGFLRRVHAANMSKRIAHILEFKIASRLKLMNSEADPCNRLQLRRAVADYHLSMAEYLGRRAPRRTLKHTWEAVRLGHAGVVRATKCLLRCVPGIVSRA